MNAVHWYPVARERDVAAGHLFHTRLDGTELVVWRDDAGLLNAWENRCPHRSVRLTIGRHLGDRLKCRYHGWEFGTQGGRCVQVPAHPSDTPPARIAVRAFPVAVAHGLAWVATEAEDAPPALDIERDQATRLLRAVRFEAGLAATVDALVDDVAGAPGRERAARITGAHVLVERPATGERVHFLLQPADAAVTIVHGVFCSPHPLHDPMAMLRAFDDRLVALRDALESRVNDA